MTHIGQSIFLHYRKCSQIEFELHGHQGQQQQQQQQQQKGLQHRELLYYVTNEVMPVLKVGYDGHDEDDDGSLCGGGVR